MVLLCICEPMYDLCRIYFHILASMRSPQASQRSKGISGLVKDPKIRLSSLPHLGQQFCPKVPTMSLTEAPRRQGGQWILLKNWSERLHKNSECYEFIWILGVVPILFIPTATPFRHDSPLPPSKASEPGAMPISLISAMHKVITRNRYTQKKQLQKKTMHKAATEHTYTMELPNHLNLHSSITTRSAKQAFQPSSLHLAILIHGCSIGIWGVEWPLSQLSTRQKQGFCGGWMLNPNMTYHWPSKCKSLAQNEEGQLQCTGQHFLRIACNAFSIASVES